MFKILSSHRNEFWDWCRQNYIACEYMGTTPLPLLDPVYDTWYIGNERDRTLAILRWA